jgi:hypothetical protein
MLIDKREFRIIISQEFFQSAMLFAISLSL